MDDNFNAKISNSSPNNSRACGRWRPALPSASDRSASSSRSHASNPSVSTKLSDAAEIVFRHLLFLNWKSPGRTIYLANGALSEKGVNRYAKYRALDELKRVGLIRLKKRPSKITGGHHPMRCALGAHPPVRWRNRFFAKPVRAVHRRCPLSLISVLVYLLIKGV